LNQAPVAARSRKRANVTESCAWVRFEHAGALGFGRWEGGPGGHIRVHVGDLFHAPQPTGQTLPLADVRLLMPVRPGKVLALWNNFGQLAAKLGLGKPPEPLYFIKSTSSCLDPGLPIRHPGGDGKMVFEGELAIVIGRQAARVPQTDALDHVFGYTCVNDVTMADILHRDPTFPQWTRAKGFDTFCPIGPAVVTGLDPATLRVRTLLDGQVRQDFPISDMRFSVAELVSKISHDMSLFPGDLILCGTSVGVGSMKPGSQVCVEIEGIGQLVNPVE
jgi:2-keto-4-pentenoate hydratase/2-oxohepta-3-ene-1,7-dioic acid hydratase in catechol pathway